MNKIIKKIPLCYPCIGFEKTATAYAKSKNFYINLDPRDQKIPGRSFINTIKHLKDTTYITSEMWSEFGALQKALIKALHKAFDPDEENKLVNIACLMNLAREEGTHVHFHVMPRYRKPVTIIDQETQEKMEFEDTFYGRPYEFNQAHYRKLSTSMMLTIMKMIQKHLDLSDVPSGELKKLEE